MVSESEHIAEVVVGIAGAIAGRVIGPGGGREGNLGGAVAVAAAGDAVHMDDVLVDGRNPNSAYARRDGRGIADVSHHCSRRDGGKVGAEVEAVDFHSVQVAVHNEGQVSDRMGEGEDEGCGFVAAVT